MLNQQIQNYKILSPLGEGGMAKVFLAEHNLLGNNIAIKLLNKEFSHNDNIRKRFLAEAKSMARMSHPNIIKVSDLIDDGDTVAFVMEYVDGETLKECIDRKGKLSDEEIKSIFSQMLEAVGYVHKQNLVHRDIKPSNFMIDPEGKVKLMDFGIAKTTDSNSAEYTQTGTGMQMGTPMYMSPEQITETKSVTFQSDIYSLGVVLWQMVTGEKPYDTKTLSTFQLQMKIVQEELPKTNTKWDPIIEKSTIKFVAERFQSSSFILKKISSFITDFEQIDFLKNTINTSDDLTLVESKPENELIIYPTIQIGNQVWMSQNLNVDRFQNGNIISQAKTKEEWKRAGQNRQPAWCYYDNNPINGEIYGKLYNWYAVIDARGLAPNGFRIPNDEEWGELFEILGGEKVAGSKIKNSQGWKKHLFMNGNGTNESGFKGLPGGGRDTLFDFHLIGSNGHFLSLTDKNHEDANYILLSNGSKDVYRFSSSKNDGFSVRCLKN